MSNKGSTTVFVLKGHKPKKKQLNAAKLGRTSHKSVEINRNPHNLHNSKYIHANQQKSMEPCRTTQKLTKKTKEGKKEEDDPARLKTTLMETEKKNIKEASLDICKDPRVLLERPPFWAERAVV